MKSLFFVLPISFVFASVFPASAQPQPGKTGGENITRNTTVGKLIKTGQLPAEVKESSGLAPAAEPGVFYTHGDAGTEPIIYKVSTDGKLLEKIKLPIPNNDWESLAHDKDGNIYICDCGNNDNNRKDLTFYSFRPENPDQVRAIKFSYPDQKKFPPKKKDRNFDSEASIWHNNQLYLFSRDRGQKQNSKVYVIPASEGTHQANLITTLNISGKVTSASISPDGQKLALLTVDKILLYRGSTMDEILKSTPTEIPTGVGQTEGSEFLDNNTLLISSEEGTLYKIGL